MLLWPVVRGDFQSLGVSGYSVLDKGHRARGPEEAGTIVDRRKVILVSRWKLPQKWCKYGKVCEGLLTQRRKPPTSGGSSHSSTFA